MNLTDGVTVLHVVLAVAVLMVGVAALYAPRRQTGVVLFLVFGVFLSSYWAVLGAPDVVLAEAVIGTGVTGALFGYVATVLPDPALKNLAPSSPSPGPSSQDPGPESDSGTGSGTGTGAGSDPGAGSSSGSGERDPGPGAREVGTQRAGCSGRGRPGCGHGLAATADLPAAGADGAPAAEAYGPGLGFPSGRRRPGRTQRPAPAPAPPPAGFHQIVHAGSGQRPAPPPLHPGDPVRQSRGTRGSAVGRMAAVCGFLPARWRLPVRCCAGSRDDPPAHFSTANLHCWTVDGHGPGGGCDRLPGGGAGRFGAWRLLAAAARSVGRHCHGGAGDCAGREHRGKPGRHLHGHHRGP